MPTIIPIASGRSEIMFHGKAELPTDRQYELQIFRIPSRCGGSRKANALLRNCAAFSVCAGASEVNTCIPSAVPGVQPVRSLSLLNFDQPLSWSTCSRALLASYASGVPSLHIRTSTNCTEGDNTAFFICLAALKIRTDRGVTASASRSISFSIFWALLADSCAVPACFVTSATSWSLLLRRSALNVRNWVSTPRNWALTDAILMPTASSPIMPPAMQLSKAEIDLSKAEASEGS